MMIRRTIVPALISLLLAACSSNLMSAPPATPTEAISIGDPTAARVDLTIYAAASLKGALDQIAVAYRIGTGNTITVSTDSSAALEAKIEQGAPADVFLSADIEHPQQLVDKGLAAGEVVVFAGNSPALVVPVDNPGQVSSAFDLARPGLRIIAAGDQVPISVYARQVVQELAGLDGAPADFAADYAANVVSREDNVRSVLTKLELGEGDAGFVYASDANTSTKVSTIDLPEDAYVMAVAHEH